ncbi:MAG: exosortase K [Spirochaetales bacterium]|nr:exosortase K [Spirochaetales bacterium]
MKDNQTFVQGQLKKIPAVTWCLWTITLGLIALLKFGFAATAEENLLWILQPAAWLVAGYTGLTFNFVPGYGFYNEGQNIVINNSCAGINYLIIVMALAVFASRLYRYKTTRQVLFWPVLLLTSYLYTVFVNSVRIICALSVNLLVEGNSLIHLCINIAICLAFLIIQYWTINKIKTRRAR